MNGLFRRLARQASGRSTTLHSPARLPFHGAPNRVDTSDADTLAEAPAPIAAAPDQPPAVAAAPDTTPTVGARPPAGADAAGATETAMTPEATVSSVPRRRESGQAAMDSRVREDRSGVRERPATAPRSDPGDALPYAGNAAQNIPSMQTARADASADDAPPRRSQTTPASIDPADPVLPDGESATPAIPPALLAPHPDMRAAPHADAARPTPADSGITRAQSASADSATEVHVHIGRIEVTAVHEPAPKPRAEKRGRAPMSLDQYLAKRQRRPS